MKRLYLLLIAGATKTLDIATPYFVTDESTMWALEDAVRRGVRIRIVVEGDITDAMPVKYASRHAYDRLLSLGIEMHEYQPTMIHAKTLVVDDFFASVGTANMDNRSFRLNFEVTAVLYGKDHADDLARQFRLDVQSSKEIKKQTREHVPLRWRIAEAGARLLSPLL